MSAYINFAARILKSNFHRNDFPFKLTFVVTYLCNYKCQTCNIWQRRPKNELTLEEIDQFFQKSGQFNWIDFKGGEPWLRPDFPDIVISAIRNCPNLVLIHFPTNGFQTKQIVSGVKKILRAKPRKLMVTVSMDGDSEVNDRIRGKQGGWRKQIETYKCLHQLLGDDVVLGMTLSETNAEHYEQAFQAAKRECNWLTANDFHINIIHESAHYYGNSVSRDKALNAKLEDAVQDYRRRRKNRFSIVNQIEKQYLKEAKRYLKTGQTPVRCVALKSSCFIDSWGDVYPCGMYDKKLGSLREHNFNLNRIWHSPETLRVQKEIWRSKCPQCWTPCEANQSLLGDLFHRHRLSDR